MIVLQSVTKRYADTAVVDDVSIELGHPGITSVIGANGAGKSTLLSMIGRLLPVDSGTITVDGLDVTTTRGALLARRLAVLRQDNHLTARLTVRDLVAFGRFPHGRGRLGSSDREAIDRAIDYLDLDPVGDRFLDELSGGQRQRAFLAMTLAQDTEYLLLDEPLNSLDLRHCVQTMRLLRRAADDLGKRVVLVLHDINFAAAYSDRIVAMRAGRIHAAGKPTEVITTAVLGQVYGLDIAVDEFGGHPMAVYHL
ncbi:iron ABC transporter ATP-binding protein [Salinispora arenicola]|uniref:iron ABC transporter ATP-binding protein n=1 Tax=Salinispora arenicola TaxID=168697 RepID=UPI0020794EB0|nr:ATP-binding cassette domain-containing protein [Salinispora arenicola]MCN0180869.1 ATP-binding cassette domain-containing protein [Salinispora arenicola]